MKGKILIADDEESIRFTYSEILSEEGFQVETADSLSLCIKKMQAGLFDLLFLAARRTIRAEAKIWVFETRF